MSDRRLRPRSQVAPCVAASAALLATGLSTSLLAATSGWWWLVAGTGGSLAAGPLLHRCGNRLALLLALLLAFLGCLTVSFEWPVLGELVAGTACGLSMPPVSLFVAERASSHSLRPLLTSLSLPAFAIGVYIPVLVSLIFQDEGWTCAVGCLCCLIAILFCVPESRSSRTLTSWHIVICRPQFYRPLFLSSVLAFLTSLTILTVFTTFPVDLMEGTVCICACLLAVPLSTCVCRRSIASYAGYLASLALLLLPYPSPPVYLPYSPPTPPQLSSTPHLLTTPPLLSSPNLLSTPAPLLSTPNLLSTPPLLSTLNLVSTPPLLSTPNLLSTTPLLSTPNLLSTTPLLSTPNLPSITPLLSTPNLLSTLHLLTTPLPTDSLSKTSPLLLYTVPPLTIPPSLPSPDVILRTFLAFSTLYASALFSLLGEVFLPEVRVMGTSLTLAAGWGGSLLALCGTRLPASILASAYVLATLLTIAFLVPPAGSQHRGKLEEEVTERETTQPLHDVTCNIEFIKVPNEMVS